MSIEDWEPVIGLEIHVQLSTRTKMFCGCELSFGEEPNTRTCPVCLGLPGSLPVVNAQAIHYGLLMGEAFGCEIAPRSIFARKNYFYPDQAKNYQISQYDTPLCRGGRLGAVRLNRIHLEEDAAKLVHLGESGRIHGSESSIVDYNRGGTPLAEIVTEPDIHSAEEARDWLALLRVTLRQLGVSDVNMEEGSLRADANVSVRRRGETGLGTKTELKNMNSFRFLMQGINAEVKRQIALLEGGERVVQETLHFDPATGRLDTLRSKEEAHDYRYFPEPDLVPVAPTEEMFAQARAALPELPAARAERYAADWELPQDTARLFAFEPDWGDFFEEAATAAAPLESRPVANLVLELRTRLDGAEPTSAPASAQAIAALARLVEDRRTTAGNARKVIDVLAKEGGDPAAIVEREGLGAMAADGELAGIVAQVIADNQDVVERIKGGNQKAMGALVGPIMKATRGRADGSEVNRLIREQLEL
jgi:aspartyl-tRNA(Asn)/glutamyl-tRNA(Gln) amidotransferase subunit B